MEEVAVRIAVGILAITLAFAPPPAGADDPATAAQTLRSNLGQLLGAEAAVRARGIDVHDLEVRAARLIPIDGERFPDDPGARADLLLQMQLEERLDAMALGTADRDVATARPRPGATVLLLPAHDRLPAQPVGLYLPAGYDGAKPCPMVVVLHGRGQTETNVVAFGVLRALADRRGAAIVAPYAEGSERFDDPAPAEIFDALHAVERFVNVDRSRVYLAGISMGGAGVFHLAARGAPEFRAFASFIGDVELRDVPGMIEHLPGHPVYLVSGAKDPIMTPAVSRKTYEVLGTVDDSVSIYVAPDGGHSLRDAVPQLERAWNDMLDGVTRTPAENDAELAALGG
jgi:poly(3-hydroxybutyrate) depolymerase